MYAVQQQHAAPQNAAYEEQRRRSFTDTLAWRYRWFVAAVAVVALLGFGYAREAVGSPLLGGPERTGLSSARPARRR